MTLPWGSDYAVLRKLFYFVRVFKFVYLIWFLKPKFVICQGMTGIYFGIIGKLFHSKSKIIGSIHESANKYFNNSSLNKKELYFLQYLDGIHYVSHGIKNQYEKIPQKNENSPFYFLNVDHSRHLFIYLIAEFCS